MRFQGASSIRLPMSAETTQPAPACLRWPFVLGKAALQDTLGGLGCSDDAEVVIRAAGTSVLLACAAYTHSTWSPETQKLHICMRI